LEIAEECLGMLISYIDASAQIPCKTIPTGDACMMKMLILHYRMDLHGSEEFVIFSQGR
jgi:hypothetical protein